MKVLIRKSPADEGYLQELSVVTDYYFPIVKQGLSGMGFVNAVHSRSYFDMKEYHAVKLAMEIMDKDEEFIIKTKEDYDKLIVMSNDVCDVAYCGAVATIGLD